MRSCRSLAVRMLGKPERLLHPLLRGSGFPCKLRSVQSDGGDIREELVELTIHDVPKVRHETTY